MFATVSASVTGASARYLEHDVGGALQELLSVWADVRSPELAEVIEDLIASLPREPLRSPTRRARRDEWVEIFGDDDPFDLPRLLDSLTTFLCGDATMLLESFTERRPNPLLASRLLALVLEPPDNYQGQRQVKFWDLLVRVMSRSADPRAREPVLGEVARLKKIDSSYNGLSAVQARLLPRLLEYLGSLDELVTALPQEELEACRHLTARLKVRDNVGAKERAEALLQEVYAAPGDDDLRMVLADALTEVGDDRGELIVIQMREAHGEKLSREMRRRQRELLTMYGRTWLGAIEPALQKSELAYRRGFPAKGRVQEYQVPNLEAVLARPEWTTFEELDVSRLHRPGSLVLRPDMTQLRRVWGMTNGGFEAEHELPFEELGIRHCSTDFDVVASCRVLPHLRHLDVSRGAGVRAVRLRRLWERGALGRQLETLTVSGLAEWLVECERQPPPIKRLVMTRPTTADWSAELTRDASGKLSHLTLTPPFVSRLAEVDLAAELPDGLELIRTVEVTQSDRFSASQRRAVERFFQNTKVESVDFHP